MKRRKPVGSGVAKVLFAFGLLALLAAAAFAATAAIRRGRPGGSSGDFIVTVPLVAAGVALMGVGIVLDRRACRRADEEAVPGFDVIVRPQGKDPEH